MTYSKPHSKIIKIKPHTLNNNLDLKWLKLAEEAMDSGVSKKEFKKFLEAKKKSLQ